MTQITTIEEKVQNACHRLNAEAYETQVIANKGKALKQFNPCAKSLELLKALSEGSHFGTAHAMAVATQCGCHNGLSEQQLMDYEYDPTYKLANYAHDHKTLYPRLYK